MLLANLTLAGLLVTVTFIPTIASFILGSRTSDAKEFIPAPAVLAPDDPDTEPPTSIIKCRIFPLLYHPFTDVFPKYPH